MRIATIPQACKSYEGLPWSIAVAWSAIQCKWAITSASITSFWYPKSLFATSVKRFVFVGDRAQLPPLGAGRPFVDIIAKLRPADCESRFPRVTSGHAELTIERRQIGTDRPDLRFARWFSNTPPSAGEDDIFSEQNDTLERIQFVEWTGPEDFQLKLIDVLVKELPLSGVDDSRNFNAALGSTVNGDCDYFNATNNGTPGAVKAAEKWQILSSREYRMSMINKRNRA